MVARRAEAEWQGDLRSGNGQVSLGSGAYSGPYSFRSRFESGDGTNPEELIAAAHAACYSMAFAATLSREGFQPGEIRTRATCHLGPKEGGGFEIKKMRLETRGKVPGIDATRFHQIAEQAEKGCPVSNALRAVPIELKAELG